MHEPTMYVSHRAVIETLKYVSIGHVCSLPFTPLCSVLCYVLEAGGDLMCLTVLLEPIDAQVPKNSIPLNDTLNQ